MLKAVATVNNRRTLFLGLDRTNTERLHGDQPIVIDVQALLAGGPYTDVQDLVITAHETLADAHAAWSELMPLPPYRDVGPDDAPHVYVRRGTR